MLRVTKTATQELGGHHRLWVVGSGQRGVSTSNNQYKDNGCFLTHKQRSLLLPPSGWEQAMEHRAPPQRSGA